MSSKERKRKIESLNELRDEFVKKKLLKELGPEYDINCIQGLKNSGVPKAAKSKRKLLVYHDEDSGLLEYELFKENSLILTCIASPIITRQVNEKEVKKQKEQNKNEALFIKVWKELARHTTRRYWSHAGSQRQLFTIMHPENDYEKYNCLTSPIQDIEINITVKYSSSSSSEGSQDEAVMSSQKREDGERKVVKPQRFEEEFPSQEKECQEKKPDGIFLFDHRAVTYFEAKSETYSLCRLNAALTQTFCFAIPDIYDHKVDNQYNLKEFLVVITFQNAIILTTISLMDAGSTNEDPSFVYIPRLFLLDFPAESEQYSAQLLNFYRRYRTLKDEIKKSRSISLS